MFVPTKTTYSVAVARPGQPTNRKGFPAASLLRITKSNQCSLRVPSRTTRLRRRRSAREGGEREEKRVSSVLVFHQFSFCASEKFFVPFHSFSIVTSHRLFGFEGLTKRPMHEVQSASSELKCINRGNFVHHFATSSLLLFSTQFDLGATFLRRKRMTLSSAGV